MYIFSRLNFAPNNTFFHFIFTREVNYWSRIIISQPVMMILLENLFFIFYRWTDVRLLPILNVDISCDSNFN